MTMKRTTVAPPRRTLLWIFAAAIVGCGSGGALSDRLAGEDAGDDRAAIVADGGVTPTNDGGSADSTNPTAAGRGTGDEAPDATSANEAGDGTSSNAGGDAGTAGEEADGGPATIGPINLASSTVYSVYVPIFSATGNLAGVTAQLPRIHSLGFDVIYLLPVTAASTSTTPPVSSCNQGAEGSVGSPYEVKDYGSIDPSLGTSLDLIDLVQTAHGLGMHVILDEVLNHTSWDNALVGQHPEYYLHCDGDRMNPASIEIGANFFKDVAQLDYITEPDLGLRAYMLIRRQWPRQDK
jgi:hypothetical protein